LFYELTNRLDKLFTVRKAALVTNSPEDESLKMLAFWENSVIHHGVRLTLPRTHSLFYEAFDKKDMVYKPIIGDIFGNFIERNILFDDTIGTVLICPLIYEDICRGLMSLTSPIPYAFDILTKGHFDILFNKFASTLFNNKIQILSGTNEPV
jgi:hypothetical protein